MTPAQHSCGDETALIKWKTERRIRITSSNVGKIAKRRKSTPVGNLVCQLLYTTFQGNASTAWGLSQEEASSHQYLKWLREDQGSSTATVTINCGLVISTSYPWLAATPDGWVEDPKATLTRGIVEFKNPHRYKDTRINEVEQIKVHSGQILVSMHVYSRESVYSRMSVYSLVYLAGKVSKSIG